MAWVGTHTRAATVDAWVVHGVERVLENFHNKYVHFFFDIFSKESIHGSMGQCAYLPVDRENLNDSS